MRASPSLLFLALLVFACEGPGGESPPPPDGAAPDGASADGATIPDGSIPTSPPPPPATGMFPDHPRTLPFTYERPDVGAPVPGDELTRVTDEYLDLLERTHWLDLVDERAHGWPESDPAGGYWYATWWSGTGIDKHDGQITFLHVDVGAENNGLQTPQILEGACYAWRLYGDGRDQHLVRRLMRGLSSWHLAMRRNVGDEERGITSRAAYPRSIMDTDRNIYIDYDANRPGVDGGASYFIHVPDNPYWPDLYVQAQRSKDDMGHLMRAVALMDACEGHFTDPLAQLDLIEMRLLYQEWAQRVESDGFRIATYDRDLNVTIPNSMLATYYTWGQIECGAELAIRLLSRYDPLTSVCDNGGLGPLTDPITGINNSSMQIVRTHHEAAAGLALVTGNAELARDLATGLVTRIESILDVYEAGDEPDNARPRDIVQLILEASYLGVPLTSREVRWIHARIEEAVAGYDTSTPEWHVRDASVPDGGYVLEPNGPGIDVKDLGLLLGSCVAPYRNPTGRPLLDCDRVAARGRP